MENKNVISCKDLIKFMNEKNKNTVIIKSCGQDIEVTPVLPLDVYSNCVDRIVEMLYDESGNYMPEFKDFFIRIVILFAYTNVDFPDDFDEIFRDLYELVYTTKLYDDVYKVVDKRQYETILEAVNSRIEYNNNNNISRVNHELVMMVDGLKSIGKQMQDIVGSISEEDVQNLMSAINNSSIDEEKLMKAYINNKKE